MPNKPKIIPKVAIIARTKDRPLLLERALKSVENQTYTDFIHVILNDGGDIHMLGSLLKEHENKRREVINNKKSVGLTKALNQAIRAVYSEYITILDDDDTWEPELLEKTITHLESTGDKAVVVKMETVIEEIRGNTIHEISRSLHPESGEGEINLFKQCHKNYLSNGAITYRRSLYNELGGYDETLKVAEDWDFGIRLLLKHDVGILRDDKPLAFYHQRPDQKGSEGNSVHDGVRLQEKTINVLRNRYLRNDLKLGRFGVGYIMNSLEHDDNMTVRLERHMNYSVEQLKKYRDQKSWSNRLFARVNRFK